MKAQPDTADSIGENGSGQMVDIDQFLAEVSTRLLAVDTIQLDQPKAAPNETQEQMQVMSFVLAEDHYAILLEYAGEVIRRPQITPVPGLPDWLMGVTNLHGDILSVVDLAGFLNIKSLYKDSISTLIVAMAADQKIGLAVDDVGLILTFPTERIISPPFEIQPELVAYLRGVVDHQRDFVRILDCERLLLGQQMQQFS